MAVVKVARNLKNMNQVTEVLDSSFGSFGDSIAPAHRFFGYADI